MYSPHYETVTKCNSPDKLKICWWVYACALSSFYEILPNLNL